MRIGSRDTSYERLSYKEAIEFQNSLLLKLDLKPAININDLKTIAGVDCSYLPKRGEEIHLGYGAIVVCSFPDLEILEIGKAVQEINFPYIPGLLSFREFPIIEKAWAKLKIKPDCLVFDGQGIAHPRRMGIASHAGILLNCPSIGSAKSILIGEVKEPKLKRGSYQTLYYKKEAIGVILRSRDNVKPIIVSPGHKMDILTAREIVLNLCRGYRLPEVIRFAHNIVNQMRMEKKNEH